MLTKIKLTFQVGICVLLFISCNWNNSNRLHKTSRVTMGTIVDVTVVAKEEKAKAVTESIFDELGRIENLTSFHKPSELGKINEKAGKGLTRADPELLRLIRQALKMAENTQGAFDPTVGALSRLWQFSGPAESRIPSDSEIKETLTKVGWDKIQIDTQAGTILLPDAGMALDLGGIAKGYALNRIVEILRKAEIHSALVNIGGDILALGNKEPDKPWLVGVEDPRNPKSITAVAPLNDCVIVTSGDYQRFFTKDGKRYHHIIDPKTGYPADKLQSVTIVGPIGATLQPAGTATFVLGVDKGIKLIESMEGAKALLIDAEGKTHLTEGAKSVFETK
jgi:thiamine biosynthesis lipoprotein